MNKVAERENALIKAATRNTIAASRTASMFVSRGRYRSIGCITLCSGTFVRQHPGIHTAEAHVSGLALLRRNKASMSFRLITLSASTSSINGRPDSTAFATSAAVRS